MVDERVDALQPFTVVTGGLAQQQGLRTGDVSGTAQGNHALGRAERLLFDFLDATQQLAFFGTDVGLGEQLLHRYGRVDIVLFKTGHLCQMQRHVLVVVDQHGVAQSDRTVMHAAPEVDRIALHLGGIFAYVFQGGVDEPDPLNANGCDQDEQRDDSGESQADARSQRNLIFHEMNPSEAREEVE